MTRYFPKARDRVARVRPRAGRRLIRLRFMRSWVKGNSCARVHRSVWGGRRSWPAPITKPDAEVNRWRTHFVQAHMTFSGDLRLALRGLRRSPLFATVAILSLALGIGANTAIFTLIDQMLLRKLPVTDPDRLVMLYQQGAHNGANMGPRMHSYPIYQDIQQRAESLSDVLCRRLVPASVSID